MPDERWVTLSNGKRCKLDANGHVVAGHPGFVGKHIGECGGAMGDTTPDVAGYERAVAAHGGDHYAGAKEFFKERLQGRSVKCRTEGGEKEAHFTGGTWQEIKRDMKGDPVKAALVPHMPDIIATGQYRRQALHKQRGDGTTAFHEYCKTVQTAEGPREAIVDVREKRGEQRSHTVYNLTREGTRNYESRKNKESAVAGTGSSLKASEDSSHEGTIPPLLEVVNVRMTGANPMPTTAFDHALDMLRAVAMDDRWATDTDEPEWVTMNGAHVPLNSKGQPAGKVGRKLERVERQKADVFGEAFMAFTGKPAEAIGHLLKEKRGHVPGAFHKAELGDIDLPWGKTGKGGFGLAHIIERRNEQGMDGEAFVKGLPRLIEEGRVERRPDYPGRAYIVHPNGEASIRLDWDREQRN